MADEVIKGAKIEIGLDAAGLKTEGAKVQATAKGITQALNSISGATADRKLLEVQSAVQKLGGVASLSGPQIARLRGEIEKLSAAGAKIPKTLQLPKLDTGKGIEALKGASLQALQGQASTLGPIGGVLSAIGPAGLAAAAGIGAVGVAAGAATAAVVSLLRGLAETSSKLTDLSSKTQLSTDFLQEIAFAGDLVGVSLDDIGANAVKLSQNIGEGDKIFAQLGLSLEKLRTLSADQQFEAVAAAIASIKDPTVQAAAAIEAFGRGGTALLPLIRSDMAGAREEAVRLGLVLGTDVVRAGDALDDSLSKVGKQLDVLKNSLAGEFVRGGGLEGTLTAVSEILTGLVRIMPTVVTGVNTLVGALSLAGAAIPGLAPLLAGAGFAVDKLREVGRATPTAASKPSAAVAGAQAGPVTFDPGIEKAAAAAKKLGEERKRAAEEAKRAEEAYFKTVSEGIKQQLDAFTKVREAREKSSLALESTLTGGGSEANLQSAQLQAQIIDSLGVKARDAEGNLRPVAEVLAEITDKLKDFSNTQPAEQIDNLVAEFDKLAKAGADVPQGLGAISAQLNQLAFDRATNDMAAAEDQAIELFKTLASVGAIPGFTPEAIDAMFGRIPEDIGKAKDATVDWRGQLQDLANLAQTLPGIFGQSLGGILSGVAGIGGAIKNLKSTFSSGAGGIFGALQGKQGIGALFGSLGQIGTIAGAAIGIGKSIFSGIKKLFGGGSEVDKAAKTGGKILGRSVSEEMAKEVVKRSKETGKSIEQVFKDIKLDELKSKFEDLKGKTSAAVGSIATGLGGFGQIKGAADAQGRIFGAQFAAVVKAEGFDKALELFKDTFSKLPDDIKANIPDEIKNLFAAGENEAFAAAVDSGTAFAEGFKGTVGLIGFSQDLSKDFGQVAQAIKDQALAGATESGLTGAEAEKASLQAIIPLLSEMKSAALASGQALDANSQALINQAEAAGISIPVDPLIEVANLLRQMLDLQRELAGLPPLAPKVDTTALAQAPPAAAKAGEEVGRAFQDGISRGVDGTQKVIENAVTFDNVQSAAAAAASGAVGALDKIAVKLREIGNTRVNPSVNVDFTGGGGGPEFASGGIGRFDRRGTTVRLHGLEAILPLDRREDSRRIMRQIAALRPELLVDGLRAAVATVPALRLPSFASGGVGDFGGASSSSFGGGGSFAGGGSITIAPGAFAPVIQIDAAGGDARDIGDAAAAALAQEHVRFLDELDRRYARTV